jgi:hypothetical protein
MELCPNIRIIHDFTILFRLSGFSEYSVGTDYRVFPNIRFLRIIQNFIFFKNKTTDFIDYTNIRFFTEYST